MTHIEAMKPINPLHATKLPDDVKCYQAALDAAFAAGVAAAIATEESSETQEPIGKDAQEYGNRLNDASWAAVEAWNVEIMGQMNGQIFNNLKSVIRAAILSYVEGYTQPKAEQYTEKEIADAKAWAEETASLLNKAQPKSEQEPKREPLTDEQIDVIASAVRKADTPESAWTSFARAIEAAHGIKREA